MATDTKRLMVSISPELQPTLDKLKKERFNNATKSEMIRYLIVRGLQTVNRDDDHQEGV